MTKLVAQQQWLQRNHSASAEREGVTIIWAFHFPESPSSRDVQLSSLESNPAAKELKDFLRGLKESAACDVVKQVSHCFFTLGC